MKICFVMATPFTVGGEQRVVSVVASLLQNRGNQVTIICTDGKTPINFDRYNLNKNVKIEFTKNKTIIRQMIKKTKAVLLKINKITGILKNRTSILEKLICDNADKKGVQEILEKGKFDVAIGVAGYYSLLLATIKCATNTKKVGWQHNGFEAYFRNKNRYYWNQEELFKKLVPRLDNYIVLTNYDKQRIKEEWMIDCSTIYNPKSFETEKIATCEEKNFFATGRMVYAKGFDILIKSFKIFSEKNKEWNLKLVGEGEENEKLINLIKEYNLEDRIDLCQFTDNVQEYFLNSSALLMPSRWEGMPMIMLEAFEMGVPVIAFDIPVVKEVITNGQEGFVVEQGNIEKYADALIEFVKDESKIKEMGENAKKLSEKFSYDRIINEWEIMMKRLF